MKFIWEPDDIKAGRYYYRNDKGHGADIGYLASVTHKIGWTFTNELDDPAKNVAISITDGMVTPPKTREEFAVMLNEGGYVPLHTDRLIEIIAYQARQNEGR